jgi:hypothetical protein
MALQWNPGPAEKIMAPVGGGPTASLQIEGLGTQEGERENSFQIQRKIHSVQARTHGRVISHFYCYGWIEVQGLDGCLDEASAWSFASLPY